MTALQPHPGPENPEKGEDPPAGDGGMGFLPFSPFPGLETAQNAAPSGQAAAALAAVRAYRRTPSPESPKLPRKPRQAVTAPDALPPASPLAGVPPVWCEGVALLAARPAPEGITPPRWRMFQATAARLLRDHGAELHAAGWTDVDLFGLHATAPAANPPGWGLTWLLGAHGEVLDVSPDAVGMRQGPDGARLAYRRRSATARAGVVPAWQLIEVAA